MVRSHADLTGEAPTVVLSGSFRRDVKGLRSALDRLRAIGCRVLSPNTVEVVREEDGFVYMRGETSSTPEALERRHLDAIEAAQFVWLHAPSGYVGVSASLEVGFAKAIGVPVFACDVVSDSVLSTFIERVPDPEEAVRRVTSEAPRTPIAVRTFQHYYRRIAIQRGYASESARDTVLLMTEELGELARAIRKSEGLVRHHDDTTTGFELADVFLYVIHLANILNVDLSSILRKKESLNHERFLGHARK